MIKKRQDSLLNVAQLISTSRTRQEFLNKLQNITLRELWMIERRTRGQSRNVNWFHYRKSIITATLSYRIANAVKRGEESERINTAITKIESVQLFYPAITYGRENEQNGIDSFIKIFKTKHFDVRVIQPGLCLDKTCLIIGGSADAIVICSCCGPSILEIKCPYSLRNDRALKDGNKLVYLDENFKLRTKTSYYYQIQTYLGIYGFEKAYLGVWTPKDILIIDIEFDKHFWVNLKRELCMYYFNSYLKHVVFGQQKTF